MGSPAPLNQSHVSVAVDTFTPRLLKLGRKPPLCTALILSLAAIAASVLAPSRAEALMVTVGGTDYDIGFVEGCFTSNDLFANPPFYQGCGTGSTTPDLYANGTGVLTRQPWWDNRDLARAFTSAYRDAALAATGGAYNDCAYQPNLGGGGCDSSPYFAFAASNESPFFLGWNYYFYSVPSDDMREFGRQSGWFAVVQSAPASGPSSVPGPLPILGLAAAFGFSRKLRKRIKFQRGTSDISSSTGA